MTEAFARLPRGRVLQYHNITPARFFAPYDPDIFRLATIGRRELASLAGRTDLALGDSEYNRRELEDARLRRDRRSSPSPSTSAASSMRPRTPALEKWLNDGLTNFLFVGRMVPNKKIEDIIRLAEHYKRYVDAHYRFIFVGTRRGRAALLRTCCAPSIAELGWLPDRFLFTGAGPGPTSWRPTTGTRACTSR